MKVTKLAVASLVLAMGASLFANGSKETKASGPVTIDLWYGAAVTEAGPPPADWEVLSILKEKFNINLQLFHLLLTTRIRKSTLLLLPTLFQICSW